MEFEEDGGQFGVKSERLALTVVHEIDTRRLTASERVSIELDVGIPAGVIKVKGGKTW